MNSRPRRGTRKKSKSSAVKGDPGPGERLQKILAHAGVGSRRACESLILEGRVEVDGKVVTTLGTRVDLSSQKIRVDGELQSSSKQTYYMVNKPAGVVSTNRDPEGRLRVIDLIQTDVRLFPVGRLDRTSEGLILVTNDGQLANRLTHPRYRVPKTYLVRVVGRISISKIDELSQGMHLAEGYTRPDSVRVKRYHRKSTDLEIVLREGRNREIRRLLARIGHKVISLCRTAVGSIKLGSLSSGCYRKLTPAEVRKLESLHLQSTKQPEDEQEKTGRRKRTSRTGRKKTVRRKSTPGKVTVTGKSPADRQSRQRSEAKGRQRSTRRVKKNSTRGVRKGRRKSSR